MSEVEISAAAAALRGLVERARAGEEVVLVEGGLERVRLVPVAVAETSSHGPRRLGRLNGLYKIPDDFDAPLPDDLLDLFYYGPLFPDAPSVARPEADGGGRSTESKE